MKDIIDLLARVLVAFIFLFEAYDGIAHWDTTQRTMTEYGVTWNQDLLLTLSIAALIIGGTLVLIGYRSGFGVILVLLYWIPATFIVHDFWNIVDDPVERRMQSILFMKNLAIIGGLLTIWVNGSGRYSVRRLFTTTHVPGT